MVNSLRQVLQTYSEIRIFYVILAIYHFQKQSVGSALKVLAKSLENFVDEVRFIVNLHSFFMPLSHSRLTLPPGKSLATSKSRKTLEATLHRCSYKKVL